MDINIQKWGNSLGLRIPKVILDELGIRNGDKVNLSIEDDHIVIKKNKYNEFSIKDMAEQLYRKPFSKLGGVASSEEFDWGNPVGDEIW